MAEHPPEGWHPDPTQRFGLRWWDGDQWTDHVHDQGQTFLDPLQEAIAASRAAQTASSSAGTAGTAGTAGDAGVVATADETGADRGADQGGEVHGGDVQSGSDQAFRPRDEGGLPSYDGTTATDEADVEDEPDDATSGYVDDGPTRLIDVSGGTPLVTPDGEAVDGDTTEPDPSAETAPADDGDPAYDASGDAEPDSTSDDDVSTVDEDTDAAAVMSEVASDTDEGAADDSGLDDSGLDDSGLDDSGLDDSGLDDSGLDDSGLDESGAATTTATDETPGASSAATGATTGALAGVAASAAAAGVGADDDAGPRDETATEATDDETEVATTADGPDDAAEDTEPAVVSTGDAAAVRPRLVSDLLDGTHDLRGGGDVQVHAPSLLALRLRPSLGATVRRSAVVLRHGEVALGEDRGGTFADVTGRGRLLLGDQGRQVHVVELHDETVRVAGTALLAWSGGVESVRVHGGAQRLSGTGWVALTTRGTPVALDVGSDTRVPRGALVLWTVEASDAESGDLTFASDGRAVVQA